ncbi:thioredoxin domain-containing protein 16 isoform X1, partial [Clarias magur]
AQGHSVALPALLVSRGPGVRRKARPLLLSTLQDMTSRIRRATLETFVSTSSS